MGCEKSGNCGNSQRALPQDPTVSEADYIARELRSLPNAQQAIDEIWNTAHSLPSLEIEKFAPPASRAIDLRAHLGQRPKIRLGYGLPVRKGNDLPAMTTPQPASESA